jgi:hypothetical protein
MDLKEGLTPSLTAGGFLYLMHREQRYSCPQGKNVLYSAGGICFCYIHYKLFFTLRKNSQDEYGNNPAFFPLLHSERRGVNSLQDTEDENLKSPSFTSTNLSNTRAIDWQKPAL